MAETSNRPPRAYTVTDMLQSINSVMEPVGGKVELKRKVGSDCYENTSERDLQTLDAQSRIKSTAQTVSGMSRKEKIEYCITLKEAGNKKYAEKQYAEAQELYLQSLVGLDFGTTDMEKKEVEKQLQVPVLCNLAACQLALKKWKGVVKLCTEALEIDPQNFKALSRRGQAYTNLYEFEKARNDLQRALSVAEVGGTKAEDVRRSNVPSDTDYANIPDDGQSEVASHPAEGPAKTQNMISATRLLTQVDCEEAKDLRRRKAEKIAAKKMLHASLYSDKTVKHESKEKEPESRQFHNVLWALLFYISQIFQSIYHFLVSPRPRRPNSSTDKCE